MEKSIVQELVKEVKSIDQIIEDLITKKDSINNVLRCYDSLKEELPVAKSAPVKTKKVKSFTKPVNKTSGTKVKFAHVLKDVLSNSQNIIHYSKDLVEIMNNKIAAGECPSSKKDMASAISAYLYNFEQRGLVKKSGDGYKYTGPKQAANDSAPIEYDTLDEAIIEILEKTKDHSFQSIVHDIRVSEQYYEIQKNLSSNLSDSVDDHIRKLKAKNIIIESNGLLNLNPKAKF
jgi:hypothetical protein